MPVVARQDELIKLGRMLVNVEGQQVLLVHTKTGIYAVENECPHQGAPLDKAIQKETYLSCPRHGYRFQLADGSCKEFPEYQLKTWPVRVENGDLIIELA